MAPARSFSTLPDERLDPGVVDGGRDGAHRAASLATTSSHVPSIHRTSPSNTGANDAASLSGSSAPGSTVAIRTVP
jgi:hypothetical protein